MGFWLDKSDKRDKRKGTQHYQQQYQPLLNIYWATELYSNKVKRLSWGKTLPWILFCKLHGCQKPAENVVRDCWRGEAGEERLIRGVGSTHWEPPTGHPPASLSARQAGFLHTLAQFWTHLHTFWTHLHKTQCLPCMLFSQRFKNFNKVGEIYKESKSWESWLRWRQAVLHSPDIARALMHVALWRKTS